MESTPSIKEISSEATPDRKPKPLSRNFEERVTQLTIITENPTDKQIGILADKFTSASPEDADKATEMARNSFQNMNLLIRERNDADMLVKKARKDALSAPSGEFKAKVAILREAEKKRAEVLSNLKSFSNVFLEVGIELDPSQIPLSLGEKIGQKAHEVQGSVVTGANRAQEGIKETAGKLSQTAQEMGGKVASGANMIKEGVQGTAGYVATEVRTKIETTKESGRESLRQLVKLSINSLNQAQIVGQEMFDGVESRAESTANRATGGISKLAEIWRTAKEGVSQRVDNTWEAASVWTNQRSQEIANKATSVQENLDQMFINARNSAGNRIDQFNQTMRSVGETAKTQWNEVSESVKNFSLEQAKRVESVTVQTGNKIKTEITTAVEKGKIFLAPAWESIQKDRERIRTERDIYGEKLGIMVEGVSDVASPIIDKILDEGRDIRDAALGFSNRQIQGLQIYGRNVATGAIEVASPTWNFLTERWENLRLRANESRVRLNTFMEAVSGKTGERFVMLKESLSERAKRTGSILTGIKIEGGKIFKNGVEVSKETAALFIQTGATAKEFLTQRKEQIGQDIEMLGRYWEIYAAGKWKESGLTNVDISRRMKLLRATGAASLSRAASIGAAAGIEGAVMLQSLARDKRGRIALTVMALGIALAANSELRDGLQNLLSNVDLSGLQLPDFSNISNIDTSAVSVTDMGKSVPIDSSSIQPNFGGVDAGSVDIPAGLDTSEAMTPPQPMVSPDATQGIVGAPVLDTTSIATSLDLTEAISPPTPDVVGSLSLPNLDTLTPGQPLEAQIRQLAGGVNENYYNLLQQAFDQFGDNFLSTAQEMVNNPVNYSPDQVTTAQQQLDAVAKLNNNPSLTSGSREWYDTIMRATHFWRPV